MKLDYFSLLSFEPITFRGIGSVKSPRLSDIAKITYPVYMSYVSALLLDARSYYEILQHIGDAYFLDMSENEIHLITQVQSEYFALNEEEKKEITFFDIAVFDPKLRDDMKKAFGFFLTDEVIYSEKDKAFITFDGTLDPNGQKKPTGIINRYNYFDFVDIIFQRINIKRADSVENSKVKNKTAEKILQKLQKGKQQKKQNDDKKMELANIISSLSSHSQSINMINIWDLTIYQLNDQFIRQRFGDSYLISSMSVAAYGDKDNKFDDTRWFSAIYED